MSVGIQMTNPRLAAFSSGPYLYLTTETFEGALLSGEQQPEDVSATFLHEWMHVAQWANVDDDAITSELDDSPVRGYDDLITESDFLAEFAVATGWEREETGTRVTFDLPDADADAEPVTTEYGDSDPVDDQPETVASVFVGQPSAVWDERVAWATDWAGVSLAEVTAGRVPLPEAAERYKLDDDFVPKDVDNDGDALISRQVFGVDFRDEPGSTAFDKLVTWYETQLTERGFPAGALQKRTRGGIRIARAELDGAGRRYVLHVRLSGFDADRTQGTVRIDLLTVEPLASG